MDYELAKELKDAGFPQKTMSIIVGNEDRFIPNPAKLNKYVYAPTLSELIEACWKDGVFFQLTYWPAWPAAERWRAVVSPETFQGNEGKGATCKAALANLWLARNRKP